ncbi:MAG: hypothetical protein AAF533_04425 [Acidobacteriota bacterium]
MSTATVTSSERGTSLPPRVVVVTRPTDYEWLLHRHGTPQQARFFLEQRGDDTLESLRDRHESFRAIVGRVLTAAPPQWRRARVGRDDLDRFLFEPGDLVVVVGRDGLVANTAKYLSGQPVIGIDPEPELNEGVLVPHAPSAASELLALTAEERVEVEERSMVVARLDDGQELVALNEIFVGHVSHQSARYEIACRGAEESQSSSGVIVATGTGSSGWARSIATSRRTRVRLPRPTDRRLVFFVREAWPSRATGAELVEGKLGRRDELVLRSRMDHGGVIFGDGIESDRLRFGWGRRLTVGLARQRLRLVRSAA